MGSAINYSVAEAEGQARRVSTQAAKNLAQGVYAVSTERVMQLRQFGSELNTKRERQGRMQAQLAASIGMDEPAILRIDKGLNLTPTLDTLNRTAAGHKKENIESRASFLRARSASKGPGRCHTRPVEPEAPRPTHAPTADLANPRSLPLLTLRTPRSHFDDMRDAQTLRSGVSVRCRCEVARGRMPETGCGRQENGNCADIAIR